MDLETYDNNDTSNVSMHMNSSTESDGELFMNSDLGVLLRIVCMGADALSLVCLLLPYALMDKVKRTTLAKLMKSYCILSLLALFAIFIYSLMEFVIPVTNAMCCVSLYLSYYTFLGSIISKVLFLFHISFIFYNSCKMVLKDTTDSQLVRLKVGYILTIIIVPLIMILIITIHNHVLNEVQFTIGNRCLYSGDVNYFTIRTLIVFVVCVHSMGILIIIILTFLLRKAYKTQKAVGQDTKNLFRIALGIVVAFGMAWIVLAFQPLYSPVGPLVFYSTGAVENLVILSVFFYNNKVLTKIKMYIIVLKCRPHKVDTIV